MHLTSRRSLLPVLLILASAWIPRIASAADYALAPDFMANPATHVVTDGAKVFRVTDTLLVPTLYLRVATEGSVFATKGAGSSTASAKGSFTVHGLEKSALHALATQLYAQFVEQLKAAGWKVLTYDDVKDDPEVIKMERRNGEGPLALPTEKTGDGRTRYAIATPSDPQNFTPAMQGLHWTFRHVGKARNATVIVPSIDIVAPQVWGETRKGYSSASAKVNTAPGMNMNYAMILVLTPKGGGGVVMKTKYAVVNATENAGAFVDAKNTSPSAANGISKGLSLLGGGGSINRSSAAYQFAIDPAAFSAGVLRGGGAFLGHVTKVITAEKP